MDKNNSLNKFIKVVQHPNGGATTLHLDHAELKFLSNPELTDLASLFFSRIFGQEAHVMGVIHNSVNDQPEYLSYLSQHHPNLQVNVSLLNSREVRTMSISQYYECIKDTFENGTFRYGNLNQLSLVGCVNEEAGGYLEGVLDLISSNIFVKKSLPWGDISKNAFANPTDSNDGPILWSRAGEQNIQVREIKPGKKYFSDENFRLWKKLEPREIFISDRTYCHLDFTDKFSSSHDSTAAAGIVKSVSFNRNKDSNPNMEVKHVVCFHPLDLKLLCNILQLDIYEPPASQCIQWLDIAKLNYLRRLGIKYSRITLYDNDLYFIPKDVIHQFQTISACTSIAWHIRVQSMDDVNILMPANEPNEKDGKDIIRTNIPNLKVQNILKTGGTSDSKAEIQGSPENFEKCTSESLPKPFPDKIKTLLNQELPSNSKNVQSINSTIHFEQLDIPPNYPDELDNPIEPGMLYQDICFAEGQITSETSSKTKYKKFKSNNVLMHYDCIPETILHQPPN